ncbi:MBL fold metallo-hydrolase [bacterium]|nr:MBL fold metallo-hydrolase [bacterium]
MLIRSWGTRGSIPVFAGSYHKYGGETTCIEVRLNDETIIILDAGSGIRNLGKLLLMEKKFHYHLFLTHAHIDHLLGFISFYPLFQSNVQIDIYAPNLHGQSFKTILNNYLSPPWSPITLKAMKAQLRFHSTTTSPVQINKGTIHSIPLCHPGGGNGYKIEEDDSKFVFLTDNELDVTSDNTVSYSDYVKFAKNADLLFHDAAYTENEYSIRQGWGHSTSKAAIRLALDAHVKTLGLIHHNQERTDEELDTVLAECNDYIKTMSSSLDCLAIGAGTTIRI